MTNKDPMADNIAVLGGVVCDNPSCDYEDMSIPHTDYVACTTCPKCGDVTITEEHIQTMQHVVDFAEMNNIDIVAPTDKRVTERPVRADEISADLRDLTDIKLNTTLENMSEWAFKPFMHGMVDTSQNLMHGTDEERSVQAITAIESGLNVYANTLHKVIAQLAADLESKVSIPYSPDEIRAYVKRMEGYQKELTHFSEKHIAFVNAFKTCVKEKQTPPTLNELITAYHTFLD